MKRVNSKNKISETVITSFGNWTLGITRNMSFWHQWMSSWGHWHHSKDFGVKGVNYQLALGRALDLLGQALSSNISHGARRELFRLREVICGQVYNPALYGVSPETLSKYFLPFALFSRSYKQ